MGRGQLREHGTWRQISSKACCGKWPVSQVEHGLGGVEDCLAVRAPTEPKEKHRRSDLSADLRAAHALSMLSEAQVTAQGPQREATHACTPGQ